MATRIRTSDHTRGDPIPDATEEERLWSSRELSEAIGDPTVLAVPLPELTPEERGAGFAVGWRKSTCCITETIGSRTIIARSEEKWELGKWKRRP